MYGQARFVASLIALGTSACALLAGCGQDLSTFVAGAVPLPLRDDVDHVILDWAGGVSALFPEEQLPPLELSKFAVTGGGTLADRTAEFRAAVLAEVDAIVSAMPGADVRIENGSVRRGGNSTVVHIAQTSSFGAPGQIGRGEYDPCNVYGDDAAVVFGEELARLGREFSFDQWVHIFANVTAHEIGHTLGFGHIARGYSDVQRPLFVELMLATHTVEEMLQKQRYMADESNCPPGVSDSKLAVELHDACGIHPQ